MTPLDLIARKRDGLGHTDEEIRDLVSAIVDGSMPDYQAAAWLMAAYLNGLSESETLALTLAMRDSGQRVDLSSISGPRLDKHSSGGVGDKTTLVVVPLLAAAGVPILKMSGRGLGYSGGTIDKLESIPGFRTDLPVARAIRQVERIGAAIIGQTSDLVPADKKLYALRDVTATVDSIPLIAASIMSKKLAGGADRVLLDVKAGRGAFMKTVERARELARIMVRIGTGSGVATVAAITDMNEPLGYAIGNALEVAEACGLLTDGVRVDTRFRDLCIELTSRSLILAERAKSCEEGRALISKLIDSGTAADALERIVESQGGDPRVVRDTGLLPVSRSVRQVAAPRTGFVTGVDAESIGRLAVALGAGRTRKEDEIDHSVGIALHKKTGDRVEVGEIVADLYLRDDSQSSSAADEAIRAFEFDDKPPKPTPLVYEVIQP